MCACMVCAWSFHPLFLHICFPVQSCLLCIASEEVPMSFFTLPPCWERMLPLAFANMRWISALLLLQRRALGGEWRQLVVLGACQGRRAALVLGRGGAMVGLCPA